MNWPRLLVVLFLVLLYVRSPIDLLPEHALGLPGLLDDLLLLAIAAWWVRGQLRQASPARQRRSPRGTSQPHADPPPRERDPYAVLGVPPTASPEEITHAYRDRIKEYHPDRVADLGEDLRRLAHDRTVEIQQAYEAVRRK